MINHYQQL